MRRRQSVRTQFFWAAIRGAIKFSDWGRRAAPFMLLTGIAVAGSAVWLTTSTKASHWAWKSWDRMFGPPSLNARPRVFALLGGNGNYTISSVNEPSAGTAALEGTFVLGVNASGAMTGSYSNATGVGHGFVYANGTFTSFDAFNESGLNPPSGTLQGTLSMGIDSAGDVAGMYADSSNAVHGFLRTASGTITVLDDPNAAVETSSRGTSPMAINDSGQITGFYTTGSSSTNSTYGGFVYSIASQTFSGVNDPNAGTGESSNGRKQGTVPLAINASGVITGYYTDSNNLNHGFIYNSVTSSFTIASFDVPGASTNTGHGVSSGTIPMSIDAAGDVVGSYTDSSLVRHGFIRTASGTIKVFDAPGATTSSQGESIGGTMATSVDPTGTYVTGLYADTSGLDHGFVYYLPLASNAAFTTFDAPNAATSLTAFPLTGTLGISVNASGTAVGSCVDSNEVMHGFVLTTNTVPTPAPTFNPAQGTYGTEQTVAISDSNPDATIYYTINGTTPTTSSTIYTGTIAVSETETIEAIAVASGYSASSVASATYAFNPPGGTPAPTPQFSPVGGSYSSAQTVTITDSASDALIYYTLDGTVPTDTSTLYTAPVTISASAQLQAIAIAPNYAPSDIADASYQITGTNSPQYVYNGAGTGQPGYNGDNVAAMQADLSPSVLGLTSVATGGGNANIFLADAGNSRIRMFSSPTDVISTFAGTGTAGYSGDGGQATAAELNDPSGVAADSSGNIYIADTGNGLIREVNSSTGVITTYAGVVSAGAPVRGCSASLGELLSPRSIAFDTSGNLYVADPSCEVVWKVAAGTKAVTVYAGQVFTPGFVDNTTPTSAKLNLPYSVALDTSNDVYIADFENNRVREVLAGGSLIRTIAGNGSGTASGDGGSATAAGIGLPWAIAVDSSSNLYIGSTAALSIRVVSGGVINTLVGETGISSPNNDGALASENEVFAESLTLVGSPNPWLLFFDAFGDRVRAVTNPAAAPTTATATPVISLSSGTYGAPQTVTLSDSTPAATIYFTLDGTTPTGKSPIYHGSLVITGTSTLNAIAIAPEYVSSPPATASYTITSAPSTAISTFATAESLVGYPNSGCLYALARDSGNDIYVIDACAPFEGVYKVSSATGEATLIAGNGANGYAGDGESALDAEFEFTSNSGIALDSSGNIYVADTYNNRVRVINVSTGIISTFAGTGTAGYSGDNGAATSAELNGPLGLAFDAQGNLYIADSNNDIVRMVSAQTGNIGTVAGTPQRGGYSGDNGPATSAYLESPQTIALDSTGNLYITDEGFRIREVVKSTQDITTIAGNGQYGATGDGGSALNAQIAPGFMATDSQGNVYISNVGAGVREVTSGKINTVVGDGYRGYWGDGGPATNAGLASPQGIVFDSSGDLFVADAGNQSIREVVSVATPVFSPAAGTYASAQMVTISSTGGAAIYYTTNGNTPTTGSTVYSAPITVSSSETVKAIAVLGYSTSGVGSAAYTINPAAVTPTVTVTPGASSITTTQSLTVTVTVSGGSGNPSPTGAVVLSGGGYTSASTALSNGSAQIVIPAATLTTNVYTFQASYTPDTNSSPIYTSASGTAASPVAVSLTVPIITWTPASTIIYGNAGSNVLNASANTSGNFIYSAIFTAGGSPINITGSTAALAAGSYTITATFTPTATSVYSSAQSTAALVVIDENVLIVDGTGGTSVLTGSGAGITSSANPGANLAVAIDSSGNVWTVGSGATLLAETNQGGASLLTIPSGTGGLNSPAAIAIDGNGQVWVANGNNSVSLFANAGTALSPATGFTDSSLSTPSGIAVDLSGSVWIANKGNNSVTQILGAAAPVAPLATAAANKTTGEKP
jgi:hypothetical protein